ncbi:hypothetical protein [Streptomyces gobiensis]|uniref:hypothetical protein n=1 Tax=Streptomyces gobiensis TaxID=2875706 RepID=UPI001E4567F7|nr:hypothetical protein [Streptomyces gobiensis]UGY92770.1 hypothetical protein test1122_14290 [Streptomyces gobiensis]
MTPRIKALCGARRPGWQQRPPLVCSRLPCVREAGHEGVHRDALADTWAITSPELEYALAILFAGEQLRELLDEGSRS